MPSIYTGTALRAERRRMSMPLATLAALSGIAASSLCGYELGNGLLRDCVRERVEDALRRVERVRLTLLPVRIDLRDVAGLREALAAYDRRDEKFFADRAAAALPGPTSVITS